MPRKTATSTPSRSRPSKGRTSSSRGRRGKKGSVSVDFDGVESGGGIPVADGTYLARPTKASEDEGSDSGQPYISWKWKIKEKGPAEGAVVWDNTSLQPQALWRLRTLLECLGYEVPDGLMDVPYEEICEDEEVECYIEITNENYEGKDKPRVTGFLPASADIGSPEKEEEEEEEEEEPPKKSKKSKKTKKSSKAKFRVGSKVKFKDEEGDTVKGMITETDGETATVEDSKGDEWDVGIEELSAV